MESEQLDNKTDEISSARSQNEEQERNDKSNHFSFYSNKYSAKVRKNPYLCKKFNVNND